MYSENHAIKLEVAIRQGNGFNMDKSCSFICCGTDGLPTGTLPLKLQLHAQASGLVAGGSWAWIGGVVLPSLPHSIYIYNF